MLMLMLVLVLLPGLGGCSYENTPHAHATYGVGMREPETLGIRLLKH